MSDQISDPHDNVFKKALEIPAVARDFIEQYLPAEICATLDFSTLAVESTSFIEKHLKKRASDVLISIKSNRRDMLIYCLAEHQSTPDPLMPLRILRYTSLALEKYATEHETTTDLPLFIPIVFYNGTTPYNAECDLSKLIKAPQALIDKYFLKPFILYDLNLKSEAELRKQPIIGLLALAMKRNLKLATIEWMNRTKPIALRLLKKYGDYVALVLYYNAEVRGIGDEEEFERYMINEFGGTGQKVTNKWFKEGEKKGEMKERDRISQRLQKMGVPGSVIAKAIQPVVGEPENYSAEPSES